jgi:uncharacterized protein
MALFVSALGLALVLEGLLYAVVPGQMKRLMAQVLNAGDDALRVAGIVAMAVGVCLVWLMQPGAG